MGACLSATKVSGSNSTSTTTTTVNNNRKEITRPSSTTATTLTNKQAGSHCDKNKPNERDQSKQQQQKNSQELKNKGKGNSKHQSGIISWGKRTDFGYGKDFGKRYSIGKLLGHGQFGYTYVATDKSNGDRVAVKKIEKSKVLLLLFFVCSLVLSSFRCLLEGFVCCTLKS